MNLTISILVSYSLADGVLRMCRLRISKSQTLEERHDDLIVFSSNVCPSNGFVLTLISMDPCSQKARF